MYYTIHRCIASRIFRGSWVREQKLISTSYCTVDRVNTKNPVTNNRKTRVQIKYFINEFAGYNLCGYSLIRISSDSISDVSDAHLILNWNVVI